MAFEKKSKEGKIETEHYICKVFTKTGLYKRVTKLEDNVPQTTKIGMIEEKTAAIGA